MLLLRNQKEKELLERRRKIEAELKTVSDALEVNESCFNEITNSHLTDAVIYEKAALEARYNYLIKEMRSLG